MSKSDPASHQSADAANVSDDRGHEDDPAFGWNSYSERMNGRLAMLAVLGLVLLEWCTNQDVFTWLGLR